jgi:hypothetical protein
MPWLLLRSCCLLPACRRISHDRRVDQQHFSDIEDDRLRTLKARSGMKNGEKCGYASSSVRNCARPRPKDNLLPGTLRKRKGKLLLCLT